MAYEKAKDVTLFKAGEVEMPSGKASIAVEVVSYDGGAPKVSLTEVTARGAWKAGRIPVEIAAEVGELMVKAAKWAASSNAPALKAA